MDGISTKQNVDKKVFKIAILPTEHKAVLDTCSALSQKGLAEIIFLKVDSQAQIDLDHLEKTCSKGIDLLSTMAANNEVGTIYPIQQIGEIAQHYGIPFLCDGSQAVGKIPINFSEWGITFLAISGHKFYAPKGIGALVLRRGQRLKPLIYGGGHQRGTRSGTLNVPGIVGLGEACRLRSREMAEDEQRIAQQRDRLQSLLQSAIPHLVVNGDLQHRLAGNLHISIPGIPNSAVIARVRNQLAISTGSACSSGVETPSHVLTAMKLPSEVIEGALRIGLGKFTTDDEVEQAADILISAYPICTQRLKTHRLAGWTAAVSIQLYFLKTFPSRETVATPVYDFIFASHGKLDDRIGISGFLSSGCATLSLCKLSA
ncbi:cysteine desulfurase family protein [Gloeomargaritales cyanobacterium VI4D9]|nr:cysteine desulfurase family protein [Gloeomargaritales cyanobacterium VI4D9]